MPRDLLADGSEFRGKLGETVLTPGGRETNPIPAYLFSEIFLGAGVP
jgi:hypothetical protein